MTYARFTTPVVTLAVAIISLAAVPAAAQTAGADKSDATTATQILSEAQAKLGTYDSIQATLRESIQLGSRTFRADGEYSEARGRKLHVELRVWPLEGIFDSEADRKRAKESAKTNMQKVTHICDGNLFYVITTLGKDKSNVQFRDIGRLEKELKGTRWQTELPGMIGLGGVGAMLSALKDRMVFSKPREETIDGKPFVLLQGRWSDKEFRKFNPQSRGTDPILMGQPIPEYVRVYFEKETLFPRRFVYLKRDAGQEARAKAQGKKDAKIARPMLTLDFTGVKLNGEIPQEKFTYKADGSEVDTTEAMIAFLKRQAQPAAGTQPGATGGAAARPNK